MAQCGAGPREVSAARPQRRSSGRPLGHRVGRNGTTARFTSPTCGSKSFYNKCAADFEGPVVEASVGSHLDLPPALGLYRVNPHDSEAVVYLPLVAMLAATGLLGAGFDFQSPAPAPGTSLCRCNSLSTQFSPPEQFRAVPANLVSINIKARSVLGDRDDDEWAHIVPVARSTAGLVASPGGLGLTRAPRPPLSNSFKRLLC